MTQPKTIWFSQNHMISPYIIYSQSYKPIMRPYLCTMGLCLFMRLCLSIMGLCPDHRNSIIHSRSESITNHGAMPFHEAMPFNHGLRPDHRNSTIPSRNDSMTNHEAMPLYHGAMPFHEAMPFNHGAMPWP